MTNDITILSCPQCGFPRIRDCGNGLYRCDDCGTHFDKNENIVLTNEEWFCQLPTEEKARFFKGISEKCLNCGGTIEYDEIGECPFGRCRTGLNEYEDWLKEIHE